MFSRRRLFEAVRSQRLFPLVVGLFLISSLGIARADDKKVDAAAAPAPAVAATPASATPVAPEGPETFSDFISHHQEAYDAFMAKYGNDMFKASLPGLFEIAFHFTLLFLIYNAFIQLLGGWVTSKFIIPLKASWPKAGFFSGAQVLTSLLWVMICYGLVRVMVGDDPTKVSAVAVVILILISIALGVGLSIAAAKFVYRLNAPTAAVFAVVLTIITSVLNALLLLSFSIVFVSSIPQISGHYGKPIFMDCLLPFVRNESNLVREAQDETSRTLEADRKKQAEVDEQTADAQQQIEAVKQKIATQQNSDAWVYAQIGQVADRGKLPQTLAAYEAFVKDRPQSPYVAYARQEIEAVRVKMEHLSAQQEQAQAEAARSAAMAESVLKEKLSKNKATLSELRNALLGKSRDEVTALLGPPTKVVSDAYLYDKVLVLEPSSGQQRPFAIIFLQGNVQTVNYAQTPSN